MDIIEPSESRPIRRSDLNLQDRSHSLSRSPSPSPSAHADVQARLEALYGPVSDPHTQPQPGGSPGVTTLASQQQDAQEDSDAGYEFRLFAAPSTRPRDPSSVPQETSKPPERHSRIRIESPSPTGDAGGFVDPHRPAGYYFARETPARAAEFALAAVDGSAILREAERAWPGNKLPWRVRFLPRSRFCGVPVFESQGDIGAGQRLVYKEESGKKRKPGKKRRIILRKRAKRKGEEELKKAKNLEEKEKEEREKRTRRNREKKVKRKEREKRKQAEKKIDGTDSGAEAE